MKTHLHILLAAMAVWIFPGRAMAADTSAEFNAANKLYAEGKFAEAAGTYKKTLQSGAVSPALYFNYGNAEFKSGHFGRAIAGRFTDHAKRLDCGGFSTALLSDRGMVC